MGILISAPTIITDITSDVDEILGSSDTPARTNQEYFDPHEIVITASERTTVYFIQFTRGATADLGYSSGNYTEIALDLTSKAGGTIVSVHTGRAPAGSKLWSRCLCPGQNTGTLSFYLGIHE